MSVKAATHEPSARAVEPVRLDGPSRRHVCRCSRQQQKFVGKSVVLQCFCRRRAVKSACLSLDPSWRPSDTDCIFTIITLCGKSLLWRGVNIAKYFVRVDDAVCWNGQEKVNLVKTFNWSLPHERMPVNVQSKGYKNITKKKKAKQWTS